MEKSADTSVCMYTLIFCSLDYRMCASPSATNLPGIAIYVLMNHTFGKLQTNAKMIREIGPKVRGGGRVNL